MRMTATLATSFPSATRGSERVSKSTDRYRAWRAAGLCGRCGEPVSMGPRGPRSRCERHLAAAAEAMLRRHRERKDAGVCVICGAPPVAGLTRCREHLAAVNDYQAQRRKELTREGWCVRCGVGVAAVRGHTLCAQHIEQDRIEGVKEYPRKLERGRELRAKYRAEGVCVRCGRVTVPGRARCSRHLAQLRTSQLFLRRRRGQRSRSRVRCPSCRGGQLLRADRVQSCQLCRGRRLVSQTLAARYVAGLAAGVALTVRPGTKAIETGGRRVPSGHSDDDDD